MGRCKCGKARIVSEVVRAMDEKGKMCRDVCAYPMYKDPKLLGLMAPLIYDEIGINLCTTFSVPVNFADDYPSVTNAKIKVIDVTYEYGTNGVRVETIARRPNCYAVTLSNLNIRFVMQLYDANCRLVDTIYVSATYLPPSTQADTYDADTNPTSVELEIFAPYGLSYTAAGTPAPIINYIGFREDNNQIAQGLNLYAMAKLLDLELDTNSVTVGITLVLQSLYYAGYKVKSEGKIDIPKGTILTPENSDCMRFVAGDLLNLAIKPLDLGAPGYEEYCKQECCQPSNCQVPCLGECKTCENSGMSGAEDVTVLLNDEN